MEVDQRESLHTLIQSTKNRQDWKPLAGVVKYVNGLVQLQFKHMKIVGNITDSLGAKLCSVKTEWWLVILSGTEILKYITNIVIFENTVTIQ